ncbi:glucose 1-dehydrogenase [Coleophoma crateriformis]|uniref:Glucose 1-dehydrogenase n=1 Tax=Coleophoma crateriformis TaxID=565419 RepID=A0A3D8RDT1_9HELO|nr:glucose 1-dehydrogenase [Coleophoma crateriformis]
MVKRVLVGYGIDVDAVSGWINTKTGAPANPTDVSRGIFGATVGIDRLLKLWEKFGIKTTWFVPAHSIESFPEQLAKVRDAGHEIGLHGYTHEFVGTLTEQQQRDVLAKSIEVLTAFTGKKPKGWTAPAWDTSKETIQLLEEFGIEYDHSFMHHDSQMYYAPSGSETWVETNLTREASAWMVPMTSLKPSSVVEVPASWHLDDWPPFQLSLKQASTHGFVDTRVVEQLWKDQFDFLYREYDNFIFPMSIHPQVSGKPQIVLMHERIFEYINKHAGVEWVTMEQMVEEFKKGEFGGVEVKGGVDL